MIDETEYQIARQWRLTGGAVGLPEHAPPPTQRSLRRMRQTSHTQRRRKRNHGSRNDEDESESEIDGENEQRSPGPSRSRRPEVASASYRHEQLRTMLSCADITAVERTIDEHAGHADAESQELRRKLIRHREVRSTRSMCKHLLQKSSCLV